MSKPVHKKAHWEAAPFFDTEEELAAARARMGMGPIGANREPVPASVRDAVFARDQNRCVRCQKARRDRAAKGGKLMLTLDHIIPRAAGGSNDPDNLRVLCWQCHGALNRGEWE